MIVISGPSGVGKGTVIKSLLKKFPDLDLVISYTTRTPRPGEKSGREYFFVKDEDFAKTDFLEWAVVHGNKYGTPNLEYDKDTIFEVDIQGARAIREKRPDCLTVFLVPPSQGELQQRLSNRKTENTEDIETRMKTAKTEMKSCWEADYVVVNDDLSHTVDKLIEIIKLEQTKRKDQKQ